MLHVQVVTPEKTLVDTEADEIIVPTSTGELAILPQHVALVTEVAPGVLTIKTKGKEETMAIDGGFVQVTDSLVRILADYAVTGSDISATKAQEAKDRAEKAMKEKKNDVEFAEAQAEFRKAILELKLAGRIKRHN